MTQRVFLDWDRPLLPQAATWLLDQYTLDQLADMRQVCCVTPGARAGRLLLGILARRCDQAGVELIPPKVVTPGALPAVVLENDVPIATREERVLAWLVALRGSSPLEIGALLPAAPADDDIASWQDLARTLETLHEEITGAGLEFSDVPIKAECLELFAEGDRWRALERVADRYQDALARSGLTDPYAAYRDALSNGRYDADIQIVLLGVTELNALQTAILEGRANGGEHGNDSHCALVHAPESLRDRFDAIGRPAPDAWADVAISVRDEHIAAADGPSDQVQVALRSIAALDGAHGPDAITIGVGDPDLIEPFARAASWAGLDVHEAAGLPLTRSAPARLLEAVAARLEDPGFATLAALLRHPDVERRLGKRLGFHGETAGAHFTVLDRYYTERLDPGLKAGHDDRRVDPGLLDAIRKGAEDLLKPLRGRSRSLAEWCDPILGVLRHVYGQLERDAKTPADRVSVTACLQLRDVLARHASAEGSLQVAMTGAAAIRFLLAAVAGETMAADARPEQIEMLGWLELHLDPAPVLVLAGCVEGRIPEAVQGGLFLPDVLRRVLELPDNRQRYARDAYLLEAITHCRERLTIIVGRRDDRGEPLAPSRLLLACDDDALLRRVRELCADDDGERLPIVRPPVGAPACGERSAFTIPDLPEDVDAPDHMAVTDFRRYLECPYRYALAKRLRLETLADDAVELDAMTFGSLAHTVLQRFGEDVTIRNSDDADVIAAWLGALKTESAHQFGADPLPAVRLQLARLEQRLQAFARVQAGLRRDGWVIDATEHELGEDARLEIAGGPDMPLSGRIDRIDRNELTGAVRIIDYKTGDTARTPFQTHHGRKTLPTTDIQWQDLQLPLYDYLARQAGLGETIEVGYLVLPKATTQVGFLGAAWNEDHLAAAVDQARVVVAGIRAGKFEINRQYDKRYDDFGRICQTLTFADDEEDEEELPS